MAYCVKCGVELEPGAKKCPLCDTPVVLPFEQTSTFDKPYPVYVQKPKFKIEKSTSMIIVGLIFLVPLLITVISDLTINKAFTWSLFVISSLLAFYVIITSIVMLGKRPVLSILVIGLDIEAFLMFINYMTHGTWFLPFALPLVAIIVAFSIILTVLFRKHVVTIPTLVAIIMLFAGILCIIIEVLLKLALGSPVVLLWSLYPFSTLLVLSIVVLIVFRNKSIVEKLKKKFFI
jgi:hypothetical protein